MVNKNTLTKPNEKDGITNIISGDPYYHPFVNKVRGNMFNTFESRADQETNIAKANLNQLAKCQEKYIA
jgi:hypothetical protein